MKQTYSFDDVLLVPKYSDINSRSEVDLTNSLSENISLALPVVSSPMDTVTGGSMATTIAHAGGLGIIHRYNNIEEQARLVYDSYTCGAQDLGAAIGMSGEDSSSRKILIQADQCSLSNLIGLLVSLASSIRNPLAAALSNFPWL